MTTTTATKCTYPYRLFYSVDRGIEWRRRAFMSASTRDAQAQWLREEGYTVEAYDVLTLPLDTLANQWRERGDDEGASALERALDEVTPRDAEHAASRTGGARS